MIAFLETCNFNEPNLIQLINESRDDFFVFVEA